MSYRCPDCFRPESNCLCAYTKQIDSGIKFVFLMHPKEAKRQRTGTGRLSRITLKDSEIIMGIDFTNDKRLNTLLNNPQYYPVLLYPGEDAWNAKKEGFSKAIGNKKILAIIIDATWFCSRKIIEKTPGLLELPKLSFYGEYRSIFTFKREPKPECVSTIETCYYLIKELQTFNLANKECDPSPLMNVFQKMIIDQLTAENERILGIRPDLHPKNQRYQTIRELPDFHPVKLR
ncbi:MAG: tRNA-uridine aminocarboxypropyltransferase [Treponema sp.]|nr:tRNA-uridine aminocarboxypropyltransferase [Treponema sp.]